MASDATSRRFLTPEQRAMALMPSLDPGFVNHRLVETFIGPRGMALVDYKISQIPPGDRGVLMPVRIDHVYTQVALEVCRLLNVPSLGELLSRGEFPTGTIVCSTEYIEGHRDACDKERARLRWVPKFDSAWEVSFELSTRHIVSDTVRDHLSRGVHPHSFIAQVARAEGPRLILAPLILGPPSLQAPQERISFDIVWYHYAFFEHFVEDIDQFGRVREVPDALDWSPMKDISEKAFKVCLCEILGDVPRKDWGGERSDHFTAHLHLQGRRLTAAFLLKGPGSGFSEMQPTHLGKNGDQICRLAQEPAELLIVQHCHKIGAAVRDTLRAFAVQPHLARRYCLIDGKDSFRLLTAYGLVDKALQLSRPA